MEDITATEWLIDKLESIKLIIGFDSMKKANSFDL